MVGCLLFLLLIFCSCSSSAFDTTATVSSSNNKRSIITDDPHVNEQQQQQQQHHHHLPHGDDALTKARLLQAPTPEATDNGELEGFEFWSQHGDLLREAWQILERQSAKGSSASLPLLLRGHHEEELDSARQGNGTTIKSDDLIVEPQLAQAVSKAWESPTMKTESVVKSFFEEVAPNVYKCQLFTPEGIQKLRSYLDLATSCGIPTRRPNGMNRYGVILDDDDDRDDDDSSTQQTRIDGAVSLKELSSFYKYLVSQYIRPIARMLFPSFAGDFHDDMESYAFTIRYRHDEDVQLKEHSDASLFTMNVNLNLPQVEEYDGSSIYFVHPSSTGERVDVEFQPGMALFHRGVVRHAARPIVNKNGGTRHNLIVWLFGKDGYVRIAPYDDKERMSIQDRWSRSDCSQGSRTTLQQYVDAKSSLFDEL